jgi:MFS family permease
MLIACYFVVHLWLHGAYRRAVVVLRAALPARGRRGGLLSRHRPLPDLVVGPASLGVFMAAIPLSNILGSLVSGFLLDLDGWMGVADWQWLFLLEAAPAVLLGVTFWVHHDRLAVAGALADRFPDGGKFILREG